MKGEFSRFRKSDAKESMLRFCDSHGEKDWADGVRERIHSVNDLKGKGAGYHRQCFSAFSQGKNIPLIFADGNDIKRAKIGRPKEKNTDEAFAKVVKYLEDNVDKSFTVTHLVMYMESALDDTECQAYSTVWMKKRLIEHFGDEIEITSRNGAKTRVTIRSDGKPAPIDRAFAKVVAYLEGNIDKSFSLNHLVMYMESALEDTGCEAYNNAAMKTKLKEQFGDQLEIATRPSAKTRVMIRSGGNHAPIDFNDEL